MCHQEKSKISLEKEKLDLEIAELKKKWFQRPNVWSVIISALLVASTILWSWRSGILDITKKKLEERQIALQDTIVILGNQRDTTIFKLENVKDSLIHLKENYNLIFENFLNTNKEKEKIETKNLKSDELIKYYKIKYDSILKLHVGLKSIENTFTGKFKNQLDYDISYILNLPDQGKNLEENLIFNIYFWCSKIKIDYFEKYIDDYKKMSDKNIYKLLEYIQNQLIIGYVYVKNERIKERLKALLFSSRQLNSLLISYSFQNFSNLDQKGLEEFINKEILMYNKSVNYLETFIKED